MMGKDVTNEINYSVQNVGKLVSNVYSVFVSDYDSLKVALTGSLAGQYDWYPAIQKAFDDAKALNAREVVFPDNQNLYVSDTPRYYSAGAKPTFRGQGHGVTILKGINNKPLMKVAGGSGSMSGMVISGIGFSAIDGADNLEIAGTCEGDIYNCRFYNGKNGIVFHNENAGEFTEYIVAKRCTFDSACQTAVLYKKTSGNESFHGTGLREARINQSDTETLPKIQINDGCFPYNAPLDLQVWTRCGTAIIKNSNTTRHASFHGDMTIECFGGAYTAGIVDTTTTKGVFYAGHVLTLGNQFQFGKRFVLVERAQYNSDGSITHWRKPYALEGTLTTGDNTIDVSNDNNVTTMLNVLVYGTNYECSYLVSMYKNRTDNNGVLTKLATQREFNGAGYGAPTLTYTNGSLVISNANFPATGLTYVITVQPLGGRSPFRLT